MHNEPHDRHQKSDENNNCRNKAKKVNDLYEESEQVTHRPIIIYAANVENIPEQPNKKKSPAWKRTTVVYKLYERATYRPVCRVVK
jgi:hypothetical protein